VLFCFLLLFLEFRKPFRQVHNPIGVTGTCFLPGFLSSFEGPGRLVLLTNVFREPATLASVVGCEWSINSLASLAILTGPSFLTGSSFGTFTVALLEHAWLIFFGGCSCLSIISSGFVVVSFGDDFLDSFKILEHRTRRFRDCLMRQIVLVPPRKREARQDDTCMSSFGERNISVFRRCNSQRAVFNCREHPNVSIKDFHPSDMCFDVHFRRLFDTTHKVVSQLLHSIHAEKRALVKFNAFY
jgi:hypothetical protein